MSENYIREKFLTEFYKNAKEKGEEFIEEDEVEALLNRYGITKVGIGMESVTVNIDGHPEKVASINFEDVPVEEAKKLFYAHLFAHTLFPHNFPRFYASYGKSPNPDVQLPSGTIRQKIIGDEHVEVKYPFKKAAGFFSRYRIPLQYDGFDWNFVMGQDGGEYYLDKLHKPYDSIKTEEIWDTEGICAYMKENKYSEEDIKTAIHAIDNLRLLSHKKAFEANSTVNDISSSIKNERRISEIEEELNELKEGDI